MFPYLLRSSEKVLWHVPLPSDAELKGGWSKGLLMASGSPRTCASYTAHVRPGRKKKQSGTPKEGIRLWFMLVPLGTTSSAYPFPLCPWHVPSGKLPSQYSQNCRDSVLKDFHFLTIIPSIITSSFSGMSLIFDMLIILNGWDLTVRCYLLA